MHAPSLTSATLRACAVLRWFFLGVSLAALLPQPPGVPFVRAVLQLFEEHTYHFASSAERNIKAIRARPAARHADADDQQLSTSLQRSGGKVLYEYLLTPHVAHALSGAQVVIGLCELLPRLYRKLADCPAAAGASPALIEAIGKADTLLEDAVLAPAIKHAEGLSKAVVRSQLGRLDPLFGRIWGHAAPQDAQGEGMGTPALS